MMNNLEELKKQATSLMTKTGFPLTGEFEVELDEKLSYMGYTTERNGKPLIVVSGKALNGNMALNLLIHELSHLYRIQSGHPSHDQRLLLAIISWVMHGKVVHPYQEKILHSIINNIEDLYADDISFKIFTKGERLNEFFIGWIHEPIKSKTIEDKWENAEKLLSAAFAQGNLERHHIVDTDEKMQRAIDEFLSKCDEKSGEKFTFFKKFMVALPEKVTEKDFEKLLTTYLSEFLKLVR